jgi:hypothetical protein
MSNLTAEELQNLVIPQARQSLTTKGAFTPTFSSLTEVGSVTKTGQWVRIGDLVFLTVRIVSAGGTSASVAATTYMNLPIPNGSSAPASVANVTSLLGLAAGLVTNNRLYLPAWVATTNEFVITAVYPRI